MRALISIESGEDAQESDPYVHLVIAMISQAIADANGTGVLKAIDLASNRGNTTHIVQEAHDFLANRHGLIQAWLELCNIDFTHVQDTLKDAVGTRSYSHQRRKL